VEVVAKDYDSHLLSMVSEMDVAELPLDVKAARGPVGLTRTAVNESHKGRMTNLACYITRWNIKPSLISINRRQYSTINS